MCVCFFLAKGSFEQPNANGRKPLYIKIPKKTLISFSRSISYSITSGSTPYYYTCKTVFLTFLITLYSLHCYWLMCFYKMGKLLIFKYETHDLSEHKNGEAYELKTAEGGRFLGREVARFFDGVPYKGVVRSYDGEVNWYGIVYTDNDKEDWDEKEVFVTLSYSDSVSDSAEWLAHFSPLLELFSITR